MSGSDDERFMTRALELAEKGRGYTSPNPMVGAVVVKGGRIVGEGFHRAVGEAHAEVEAIDDAREPLHGATLYVTLEPCNHTGRTPPCTEKILAAGIGRVVFACCDPNRTVKGGGAAYLMRRGVEITEGVCEAAGRRLNEVFFKFAVTGRPFVLLKCAATLDGWIATRQGHSKWITGETARAHVHELRHWLDAVVVGVGTVRADNPRLTVRLPGKNGRNPLRVVLDTHLSIDEDAVVLKNRENAATLLVTAVQSGSKSGDQKKERLLNSGIRVIETPVKDGMLDIAYLMRQLAEIGITGVLIEGGSRVAASALKAGIVDKVQLFYAPKLLGGSDGFPIFAGPGPERMDHAVRINNMRIRRFDEDFMVEGEVEGAGGIDDG